MSVRCLCRLFVMFVLLSGSDVLMAMNKMNVWIAPDTCKVNPRNGNVLEEHYFYSDPSIAVPGYIIRKMHRRRQGSLPYYVRDSYAGRTAGKFRKKNPIWSAAARRVSLRGARNEFVAFQIIIEKPGDAALAGVAPEITTLTGPAKFDPAGVRMFREHYMRVARDAEDAWNMTGQKGRSFWYPEVLVPFEVAGQVPFAIPDAGLDIPGQSNQAVWVDVYVPHGQKPGTYAGTIRVAADGAEPVEIKLLLEVLPLTLPDELNFMVDMMSSARPIAEAWKLALKEPRHMQRYLQLEEKFFRLFHAHRCTLNMFPGSPSRPERTIDQVVLPGFSPKIAGRGADIRVADWSAYDAHFGKYYTGEAFADLPRKGQPLTHQFLPFSLGWPSPLSRCFDNRDAYETEFTTILKAFADHFAQRGWTKTQFQFFLNGKRKFGEPWDTDEPTRKSDYDALRYWGELTRQALGPREKRKVNILYRVDIGTPGPMPGKLEGVVDVRNVNYEAYNELGFFWSDYRRQKESAGETWWYYAADRANQRWARIDWSMASSFLWAWALWDLDVRTCCKWASLAFDREDPLHKPGVQWSYCAYAYPGRDLGYDGPLPSLKLKATRRGLEDMEYLHLLATRDGNTRRADAILRKHYAAWNRRTKRPKPPGSVRVGPEAPYRLRADVLAALK